MLCGDINEGAQCFKTVILIHVKIAECTLCKTFGVNNSMTNIIKVSSDLGQVKKKKKKRPLRILPPGLPSFTSFCVQMEILDKACHFILSSCLKHRQSLKAPFLLSAVLR